MVTYKVTLLSEEHDINSTIDCNDDVFILDAAEEQGIGIERIFLVHSPKLDSITVLRSSKVRRSKLYYLRNLRGKASRLKQTFR